MARLNTMPPTKPTHEGAPSKIINHEQTLRRSVMACMLWEHSFYEQGEDIAARIARTVSEVPAEKVADIAREARGPMNLRHAPLMLASALAHSHRGDGVVREVVRDVIQRADELAEILAIHAKVNGVGPDGVKKVLGAQMKRGLADAFRKFDAYQLAKYNRKGAITLRDVLFMCHAKPESRDQEETWKRLVDGTLEAPDTWEVGLSGGKDKRETFTRLLAEGKLGYLALLRNLRNMSESGVDDSLIRKAILARKGARRVLPFRYIAAAKHAPKFEPELDAALVESVGESPKLPGETAVLVDVSGSMFHSPVSGKSELTRMDAAAALGAVVPAERMRLFTFSNQVVEVPPRKGMAGVDAIVRSQMHGGTALGAAVRAINRQIPYDRLIVVTDEQSADRAPDPVGRGYMINVASYERGVGYGKWTHIDGFSEAVLRYIQEVES